MEYLGATQGFVEKLLDDYLAGRPMDRSIPGVSPIEAEHFAGQMMGVALLEMVDPHASEIESEDGASSYDLVQIALAGRFREAARKARARERAVLEERAERALVRAAMSPVRTCAIWYEDIYDELAQSFAGRGDHAAAIDFAKRRVAYDLRYGNGANLRSTLRDLAALSIRSDPDAALGMWTAIVRHDPRDRWTYVQLDFAAEDAGLEEIARAAVQRGLEVLRGSDEEEDARSLREQLESRAREPLRSRPRCAATEVALRELRLALADGRRSAVPGGDEGLARALLPDLDVIPCKRPPTEADLIPREHFLRAAERPAAATSRPQRAASRARRWRPAEGEPVPPPTSPCPCGSGRRYKKCCKPR